MEAVIQSLRSFWQQTKSSEADPRARRRLLVFGVLLALLPLAGLLSLMLGPMELSARTVLGVVAGKLGLGSLADFTVGETVVVWDIRLSRALLAVLVGGGLAMAGATMQGVFRNPLADPGIIGVSGGGAIGAILMIVLGGRILPPSFFASFGLYAVPLAAMLGAVLMTFLIYRLSLSRGQVDLVSMLLVGIAINALGGALIGLMTFISTDEELRTMTFWGLGSLGRANWNLIVPGLLFILPPLLLLPRYANALNALLLGEAEARHLGINTRRVKTLLIALSASIVGATVALCGTIGFIALVAPHMMRSAIGPDHRFLIPAGGLWGAALLLMADLVARTMVAPAELPIGILTALLGAPVFLFLLLQRKRLSTIG
ncbi:MAG: FecCD family ABC transporter permease [Verrucomicrobiota bacterium]